jgi:hypothetical protein
LVWLEIQAQDYSFAMILYNVQPIIFAAKFTRDRSVGSYIFFLANTMSIIAQYNLLMLANQTTGILEL